MAISENIQEMAEKIGDEIDNNPGVKSPTAQSLHEMATNAILGGAEDWAKYMKLFAKTDDELARLIPTDGSTGGQYRSARAYLAANGMCTDDTTRTIQMRVSKDLDL